MYRHRTDLFWVAWEFATACLMWIALGTFLYYAVRINRNERKLQLGFGAYDALPFSPAHFFMLRRQATAAAQATTAAVNGSSSSPLPGAPLRWMIPEDPRGLRAAAQMTAFANSLFHHCESPCPRPFPLPLPASCPPATQAPPLKHNTDAHACLYLLPRSLPLPCQSSSTACSRAWC